MIAEFDPEAVSMAYKDLYAAIKIRGEHEKEFPLENLKIIRELGEGAFGVVSQAQAKGIFEGGVFTDVAVKQLRAGSNEADEFFREVDFMSGLDHPNIVRLLGECLYSSWGGEHGSGCGFTETTPILSCGFRRNHALRLLVGGAACVKCLVC